MAEINRDSASIDVEFVTRIQLKNKVQNLEGTNQVLVATCDNLKKDVQHLTQVNSEKNDIVKFLEDKVSGLTKDVEDRERASGLLQNNLKYFEDEIKKMRADDEAKTVKIYALTKENVELNHQLEESKIAITSLKQTLENLMSDITRLEVLFKGSLQKLEMSYNQMPASPQSVSSFEYSLEKSDSESNQGYLQKEAFNDELTALKKQVTDLTKSLSLTSTKRENITSFLECDATMEHYTTKKRFFFDEETTIPPADTILAVSRAQSEDTAVNTKIEAEVFEKKMLSLIQQVTDLKQALSDKNIGLRNLIKALDEEKIKAATLSAGRKNLEIMTMFLQEKAEALEKKVNDLTEILSLSKAKNDYANVCLQNETLKVDELRSGKALLQQKIVTLEKNVNTLTKVLSEKETQLFEMKVSLSDKFAEIESHTYEKLTSHFTNIDHQKNADHFTDASKIGDLNRSLSVTTAKLKDALAWIGHETYKSEILASEKRDLEIRVVAFKGKIANLKRALLTAKNE